MRVLLVGNTGYITKEFVQEAFPESEVFIMGNSLLKTERKKHLNVRPFTERDEELEDIFHTYYFELMVYFSNYITFHGTMEGEAEKLRKVLSYCKRSKEIHVIYLTGPEAGYAAMTGKTLLVRVSIIAHPCAFARRLVSCCRDDLECAPRCSAHLQRKNDLEFRNSGKSADFPELPFHGRGRSGKRQLPRLFPAETAARRVPSQAHCVRQLPRKGELFALTGRYPKLPLRGSWHAVRRD